MNESAYTPERRNSPRRQPRASVRAYLRLGGLDLGPDLALRLLDLSEGGAGLLVKEAVEVGKEVSVGVEGQTHPRPVVRVANVVWCKAAPDGGYAVGVAFQKGLPYRDFIDLTQPIREAEQRGPIPGQSSNPPTEANQAAVVEPNDS